MQCPNCKVDLTMADRQGIEIDYCPKCRGVWLDRGELDKIKCRGVWLDRGELDKIIERTAGDVAPARAAPAAAPLPPPPAYSGHGGHYRRDDERGDHYKDKRYKRKSMLGELFDF
jgi:uncharacterized protein